MDSKSHPRRGTLASVQVGLPQQLGVEGAENPLDRPWTSAIFKDPVDGPVEVRRLGLEGDGQADLRYHGGPNKAVHAYSAMNFGYWRQTLSQDGFGPGAFGENLTFADLAEPDVCIGDRWAIGSCVLEVSQPRRPCHKLAKKLRVEDMVVRVQESGRSGWYLRVIEEGSLQAGDSADLLERPHPRWTVALANDVMYGRAPAEFATELGQIEVLSQTWRDALLSKTG